KPGTLAQYGDSITISMAFLGVHSWAGKIAPEKCPPDFAKDLDELQTYAQWKLWKDWKSSSWGNDGGTTVPWFHGHVDRWQKKMNPEVAVILFGTNDTNTGPMPPVYTEIMG